MVRLRHPSYGGWRVLGAFALQAMMAVSRARVRETVKFQMASFGIRPSLLVLFARGSPGHGVLRVMSGWKFRIVYVESILWSIQQCFNGLLLVLNCDYMQLKR